jgi:hypothetical protein
VDAAQCEASLFRLLKSTLRLESLTAERDRKIAEIENEYAPRLEKETAKIASLEAEIEAFYRANRAELEVDGKKSVQMVHGTLGMRAPSNPALVPLDEKWTWERIARCVKRLYKMRYFHPPKPPALNKVKIKSELSAEELAGAGLRLEGEETFYYELNRGKEAAA